ncbi:unnamed protein product (macronuclear) [Paramecium tetraurelia]|uniref:Uncharacterized protein n=1 Tax=Paramecium tetraurelia TaxID=5888 RepID=A0C2P4_PARTE|nr:uncharacterized protein GSPATT00034539001 [Paramecium tetraurelia]CAK65061.1 unnamed protein product [Paramecium tetraurelia]|eukprot:XP_001432458.1 hypothetical protein (macronuclear) [Paramecium tetraurelia strain d4-2]
MHSLLSKHLCVSIRIEAVKQRAIKLFNLVKTCKSFQKNIQRNKILASCKEKQLYVDPEKEYLKNFDLVFIVQGLPQVPQEQIELILHVKEGVINWGGVEINQIEQPEELQDDFEERMDDFLPLPPIKRQYSEKQFNYAASERSPEPCPYTIGQLTIKEFILDMDFDFEEETIIFKEIYQFICQMNSQQEIHLIIIKEAPKSPFDLEVERIQHELCCLKNSRKQLKRLCWPRNTIREPRKTHIKLKLKNTDQMNLEIQSKRKIKLLFNINKRQLSDAQLQKVGSGILFRMFLDQLQTESTYLTNPIFHRVTKSKKILIKQIKFWQVQEVKEMNKFKIESRSKQQALPNSLIFDDYDWIEMRAYFAQLHDQQLIVDREHKIIGDASDLREIQNNEKSNQVQVASIFKDECQLVQQKIIILQFEELLKENQPEQEWHFGDRIYMERHNRNTLRQKFYQALLNDPQVIIKDLPDGINQRSLHSNIN